MVDAKVHDPVGCFTFRSCLKRVGIEREDKVNLNFLTYFPSCMCFFIPKLISQLYVHTRWKVELRPWNHNRMILQN